MLEFLAAQDSRKIISRARKLHSEGKTDRALKTIESGLKGGSEDFALILELGRINFESGKRKEASSLFKRAHSLVPSRDGEVITVVEDLHYGGERSIETGEVLLELYVERREFEEAERILDSLGSGGVDDLADRYGAIYENVCKGKAASDMNRRDILIHYCLALIYEEKGELEKTYSIFDRLEQADPGEREVLVREERRICQTRYGDGYPHLALGALLLRMGNPEGAVSEFTKAVELDKELEGEVTERLTWIVEQRATPASLGALATLHISQGKLDQALHDLERLLEVDPSEAVAVAKKYREVLRLDPKNVRARMSLGDLYLAKGQNDQAISEFSQALDTDPQVSDTIVEKYHRILETDPGNTLAITYLADAHIKRGDLDRATQILKRGYVGNRSLAREVIPRLEEILESDLDKAEAVHLLAEVHRERGEVKRALSLYDHLSVLRDDGASLAAEGLRKMVEADPSNDKARLLLGAALIAAGDSEEGMEQLSLLLNSDLATEVISKLDRVARRRPEAAEAIVGVYEQLADRDVDPFILRFAMGEAYTTAGNLDRAVASFRECLQIDGIKHEEVIGAYERVLAENEGFAPAHFALADAYLLREEVERAVLELERVAGIDEGLSDEVLRRYFDLLKRDENNYEIRKAAVGLLMKKGMYQEAMSLCKRGLEILPAGETAYFHLRLGEAHIERGDLSKAVVPLTRSLDLDPSLAEDASSLLKRILAVDPDNIQARYSLARAHLSSEDFEKAVEEFSIIAETHPSKRRRVIEELQRIYILDPTNGLAHYARGRLLLESEEAKGAISEFERSLELGPQLLDKVILSLEQLLETYEGEAKGYLTLGRALIRKRMYEPAALNLSRALSLYPALKEPVIGALSKIREEDPSNTSARFILADILTKEAKFSQAVDTLKEIEGIDESKREKVVKSYVDMIPFDPSNISLRYALADSYAKLGKHSEAVSQYEQILALRADEIDEVVSRLREVAATGHRRALLSLARALIKRGEYQQATEKVREMVQNHPEAIDEGLGAVAEVLALSPREVQSSLLLGELQLQKGRNAKAIESFEKGLRWAQETGDKEELCLNLSRALYRSGEDVKARQAFERARELAPDILEFDKRVERLRDERVQFLIEREKGSLEKSPDDLAGKLRLASLFRRAGRPREALEHLDFRSEDERLMKLRAIELALSRAFLGDLMTGIEALRSFDLFAPLSPEDKEVLYDLGLLYERTGELPAAVSALRRVASFDQGYRDVARKLEYLYEKMVAQRLGGGSRVIEGRSSIV